MRQILLVFDHPVASGCGARKFTSRCSLGRKKNMTCQGNVGKRQTRIKVAPQMTGRLPSALQVADELQGTLQLAGAPARSIFLCREYVAHCARRSATSGYSAASHLLPANLEYFFESWQGRWSNLARCIPRRNQGRNIGFHPVGCSQRSSPLDSRRDSSIPLLGLPPLLPFPRCPDECSLDFRACRTADTGAGRRGKS